MMEDAMFGCLASGPVGGYGGYGGYDSFGGCLGGWHDFAVGESHAICNRCQMVVPLNRTFSTGTDTSLGDDH